MPSLDEALAEQGSPLNESLKAGVGAISANAVVTFTQYIRVVLPIDGYVFWVKADLLSASAIYNGLRMNAAALNQPMRVTTPAPTFKARGSLHYATDTRQEETEVYTANRVVFTAIDEVQDLNAVGPYVLYIGEVDGLKFAFNTRGMFYAQAKLYHYSGFAVYADMATQLVDRVTTGFNSQAVIVSNSLPIWLSMNSYVDAPWKAFGRNEFVLYPSFLLPTNILPPFAAVHVPPESTKGVALAPTLGPTLSHDQLSSERVRVTLWGTRNYQALDFLDFVNQFTLDGDVMGIMNIPVPHDEKRTQSELGTIAQKKTIEFEINYLQSTARNVARQIIESAVPTFYFGD